MEGGSLKLLSRQTKGRKEGRVCKIKIDRKGRIYIYIYNDTKQKDSEIANFDHLWMSSSTTLSLPLRKSAEGVQHLALSRKKCKIIAIGDFVLVLICSLLLQLPIME